MAARAAWMYCAGGEPARAAGLILAGKVTTEREASLVSTGMIERSEIDDIKWRGGVGELLGHFCDARGCAVESLMSDRALALPRAEFQGRRIVAVAEGRLKYAATKAVLESHYLKGLITDEATARAVVALDEA